MGCDIHPYWEARVPDGTWYMVEAVDPGRSYSWFGLAAGVRRPRPNSLEPRGIPHDPSWSWSELCKRWGPDFHSHSWLTPSEVRNVNRIWCEENYEDFPEEWGEPPDLSLEFIEVLSLNSSVESLLLWDDVRGKLVEQPFAGTLAEFIGSQEIEEKVRLVFAFDN